MKCLATVHVHARKSTVLRDARIVLCGIRLDRAGEFSQSPFGSLALAVA